MDLLNLSSLFCSKLVQQYGLTCWFAQDHLCHDGRFLCSLGVMHGAWLKIASEHNMSLVFLSLHLIATFSIQNLPATVQCWFAASISPNHLSAQSRTLSRMKLVKEGARRFYVCCFCSKAEHNLGMCCLRLKWYLLSARTLSDLQSSYDIHEARFQNYLRQLIRVWSLCFCVYQRRSRSNTVELKTKSEWNMLLCGSVS